MKTGATLLALGLALAPSRGAPALTTLHADLRGSNEVPGPGMTEPGAQAILTVEGETVTLMIVPRQSLTERSSLRVPGTSLIEPMVVHVHEGAEGANGRLLVEFPWTSAAPGWSLTVTGAAPRRFAERVAANPRGFYVEVHTKGFPAGAARGQLHVPSWPAWPPGPSAGLLVGPGGPGLASVPHRPGSINELGRRPGAISSWSPEPRPPSLMTWEFFFRNSTPADERAASLIESELPVLRQLAGECVQALDEADPLPFEGWSRILDEHVGRLRSRLGEAAFISLESYLQKRFEEDADGSGPSGRPSGASRAGQELRFRPIPYKIHRDPDFRLEATATSGLRVYFTASGDCSVRGSTAHLVSAGSCWITAHQPGNGKFDPAPEVTQLLRIGKAEQRISGVGISPKTYLEPDFPLVATASSGLPVVFQTAGQCSVFRGMVHLLGAGSCYVTAHQPGNPNFTAARIVAQEFPIAKADQKIELPAWENPPYGPDDLRLDPRSSSGLRVTVNVTGPCAFTGSSLRILRTGSCTVIADQSGNADFNPAPTEIRTIEVVANDDAPAAGGAWP